MIKSEAFHPQALAGFYVRFRGDSSSYSERAIVAYDLPFVLPLLDI